LEASAVARLREAEVLYRSGRRLGAVYLFGYAVEITLKCSYYRVIGLVPSTLIDPRLHRRPAEDAIRNMIGLPSHPQGPPAVGHNVVGWARLVEQERAKPVLGRTALSAKLTADLHARMMEVFNYWAEFLRYRNNKPYHQEVIMMRINAKWIRRNYRRLWS
jgi:hypothetical protein